ncbi:MAG: hypothetical protein WDW38_001108 [Sanguina aurantia]
MVRPVWKLEDYTLLQKVYSGHASSVYKAFCKWSMSIVAIKMYDTTKLHDLSRHQLGREIRLHASLDHKHVIRLHAAFAQVRLREGSAPTDYMAPEVLRCPMKRYPDDNKARDDLGYSSAVDVWAVGVLTYELLNGCPPFTSYTRQQTEELINTLEPEFVTEVSAPAEHFITSCLAKSPMHRPPVPTLQQHPWISSNNTSHAAAHASATAATSPAQRVSAPGNIRNHLHNNLQHNNSRSGVLDAAEEPSLPNNQHRPAPERHHSSSHLTTQMIVNNNSHGNSSSNHLGSSSSSSSSSVTALGKPNAAPAAPAHSHGTQQQQQQQHASNGSVHAEGEGGQGSYAEQRTKTVAASAGAAAVVFGKSVSMLHARAGAPALMPLTSHSSFKSINLN